MKYPEWYEKFVEGGNKEGLELIKSNDLKSKIQAIKDRILNRGSITSKDLDEAGGLIFEDLKNERIRYEKEIEELQEKIKEKEIEVKNLIRQSEEIHYEWGDLFSEYMKTKDQNIWREMEKLKAKVAPIDKKIDEFSPIIYDLQTKLDNAKINYKGMIRDNAEELKNKLSQIRAMGNASLDIDAHLKHSRSPMRKIVKEAYDYYPTEWVQQSAYAGTLTPKKVNRGYYKHLKREIGVSGDIDQHSFKTAIHELGHRFERVVPGILEIEKEFYEKRTAEEPLEWLGPGYAKDEKTRKDKFINRYIGKDYDGLAYELVSMGFEYAYTDPTKLWQDEEYAKWIYGILALL